MGETTTDGRDDALADVVRVVRALLVAAGVLATLPVVASLVLRQVALTTPRLIAYVSGTPVVIVAGVGAVVLFALGGWRPGTAGAAVLTVVLALTQAPLFLGTGAPAAGSRTLTVMTINLHFGAGDMDQVLAIATANDVDVLATQELPLSTIEELRGGPIDDVFPYRLTNGLRGSAGNGLWSRVPLDPAPSPVGSRNTPVAARVELAGRQLLVACVHPQSPYPDGAADWSREMGLLADWLATVDGPAVVAGDFNATPDHRQFREVLDAGFADAATQAGVGWLPTFPANRRRIPLLVAIDHVIASGGIVATNVERIEIADTDHTALLVRLAIPPGV